MVKHPFLFLPGTWLGEGSIILNMVEESLFFVTRWKISAPDSSGNIEGIQEIQVRGLSEVMHNNFRLFNVTGSDFKVELANQALGKVEGSGVIEPHLIGWEFRVPDIGFDGFEIYEKVPNSDEYTMRAEFASKDDLRTQIDGRIWPGQSYKEPKLEEL